MSHFRHTVGLCNKKTERHLLSKMWNLKSCQPWLTWPISVSDCRLALQSHALLHSSWGWNRCSLPTVIKAWRTEQFRLSCFLRFWDQTRLKPQCVCGFFYCASSVFLILYTSFHSHSVKAKWWSNKTERNGNIISQLSETQKRESDST